MNIYFRFKHIFIALLFLMIFSISATSVLATSTWTNQGNMKSNQLRHKAVLLNDGTIFAAGGAVNSPTRNTQQYFDGAGSSGGWIFKTDMIKDRDELTLHYITVSGGTKRVLAVGGFSSSACSCVQNTAELWNQSTNTWSATATMNASRRSHASSQLSNGDVFVTGGVTTTSSTAPIGSTEVYNPINNSWTQKASMSAGRAGHAQITFIDGSSNSKVMIIGGYLSTGATSTTEIYDPSNDTWTAGPSLSAAVLTPEAVLLNDGRILVLGSNSEVYNPSTNSWSSYTTSYNSTGMKALVLDSSASYQVLAVGGGSPGTTNAMLFDPSTNTWSTITSMNTARREFTLTLLSNGDVIAAGGANGGGLLKATERFDY